MTTRSIFRCAAPLLLMVFLCTGCVAIRGEIVTINSNDGTQVKGMDGWVRHVVCFKFKDDAPKDKVREVEKAFARLPKKIKEIKGYEWGTDISPEKLSQGFTHCFFLTFKDEHDRDVYLDHPAHKEFAGMLGPVLDKVFVVDYKIRRQ